MSNEIQIVMNPVEPGVIKIGNLEELKSRLSGYLEEYRGAAYTEETKGFAKKTVADLRKLKKSVNDVKIAAKKEYMKPCDEFEAQVKELLVMIDEPICLIDRQLKDFEETRVRERQALIRELYDQTVGASEYAEYIPLQRIYSAKWENVSVTRKAISDGMTEALEGTIMDVESIRTMVDDPEAKAYALKQYKAGKTVIDAMKSAKEYMALIQARKERESREREEAALREELRKAEEAAAEAAFLSADEEDAADDTAGGTPTESPFYKVPEVTVTYTVRADQIHIMMLESFMTAHEIQIVRRSEN